MDPLLVVNHRTQVRTMVLAVLLGVLIVLGINMYAQRLAFLDLCTARCQDMGGQPLSSGLDCSCIVKAPYGPLAYNASEAVEKLGENISWKIKTNS